MNIVDTFMCIVLLAYLGIVIISLVYANIKAICLKRKPKGEDKSSDDNYNDHYSGGNDA